MVSSRFVLNGDVGIHYLDSGGADHRPPVVFVPGMTDVAEDYADVLHLLGRRALVVDLRGHGKSDAPVSGYDAATLSTDVGAVVDAVTAGPVHVVTFSRGTTYAVAWVIANSHRVRSLSVGDYVPEEKVVPEAVARRLLEGRWRGTPVLERLDQHAALQTFRAAQGRSYWEPLSQLPLPLLAVRSGDSVLVDEQEWGRYRRLFPQARLVEFPDAPHDIFRPDRTRYPRLVRDHIDHADHCR